MQKVKCIFSREIEIVDDKMEICALSASEDVPCDGSKDKTRCPFWRKS